jgi:hypothetical protein
MTAEDVSLVLAVLGGTSVFTSWVGRRTGDATRDSWLMFGVGACQLACAGLVYSW